MTASPRHVVVTGAAGFIGAHLSSALLAHPVFAEARFTLTDLRFVAASTDPRVRQMAGDIADPMCLAEVLDGGVDTVFHMAAILGGTAESDYALARRVNVEGALSLLEALRDFGNRPRLVYASSIAVFGAPMPGHIDDASMPFPTMTYGAQKRMIEIAVEQFSARGWIDGISIRLPGIVARADADARLRSAFLNTMFHAYASGEDFTLPVSPDGTTWLISVPACVAAFVHAGLLPGDRLGQQRALTLPAQRVAIEDIIAALKRKFPGSASKVTFAPDAELTALFAAQPPLTTALGDALGFQHDGGIDALVDRALSDMPQ